MCSPRFAHVTSVTGIEIPCSYLSPNPTPLPTGNTLEQSTEPPLTSSSLTSCQNHQCSPGRDAALFGLKLIYLNSSGIPNQVARGVET